MSKRIYSLIVIVLTIIYVSISLHVSETSLANMLLDKPIKVLADFKTWGISKIFVTQEKPIVKYDEVKQSSIVKPKDIANDKKSVLNANIIKMPINTKNAKLERIYLSEKELLKSIFDKTDIDTYLSESSKGLFVDSTHKNTLPSKDETQVFKSMDNKEGKLTVEEIDKLKGIAKKLSPMDQDKINKYLESNNSNNVLSAIELLRNKLSENEYDSIKSIADKYNKK